MTVSVFIAVTDQMSWGRGLSTWEAVGNAIFPVANSELIETIVLYDVKCPSEIIGAVSVVRVNEQGAIVAPPGSKVVEVATIHPARQMVKSFHGLRLVVDKEIGK